MKNDPFEHIRRMQEIWNKLNAPFNEIQKQMVWANQISLPFQRIQEQMDSIHRSLDSVNFGIQQEMFSAINPAFEQLQGLALNRSFLNTEGVNQAFQIDFSKISPILEFAQKHNLTFSQISQNDEALQRWEALLDNISESKYLDDEVEDVELTLSPASVPPQENAGELVQNGGQTVQAFTWRDLLQIASLLIMLITWLDSGNSRTTSLAEEAYQIGSDAVMEITETLDDMYEFFISNFPAEPVDSEDEPELPENP